MKPAEIPKEGTHLYDTTNSCPKIARDEKKDIKAERSPIYGANSEKRL
ncbi:MAG: hypothetical protein ABEK10_03130 [Candidatus Nanosalina sp.]